MARHRLIADAARGAGARVVLFAHTDDDIIEADIMRAEGSTLGRLRDWAPSPAWPEGRGLMLLRPMLRARRADIRDWLTVQGEAWIDDPANGDPRFTRSRVRASLIPASDDADREPTPPTSTHEDAGLARVPSVAVPSVGGALELDREAGARTLGAAVVCAGGGDRPPRSHRLSAILARLRSGEAFTATLCGARVSANGDRVLVSREPGEFARLRAAPMPLEPGVEAVWDGRWAITVGTAGWSAAAAAGRMAALSGPERLALKGLAGSARGAWPVLIRGSATAPVLAGSAAKVRSLVEERLALALDRMTHERDLDTATHGGSLRKLLFPGNGIIT